MIVDNITYQLCYIDPEGYEQLTYQNQDLWEFINSSMPPSLPSNVHEKKMPTFFFAPSPPPPLPPNPGHTPF